MSRFHTSHFQHSFYQTSSKSIDYKWYAADIWDEAGGWWKVKSCRAQPVWFCYLFHGRFVPYELILLQKPWKRRSWTGTFTCRLWIPLWMLETPLYALTSNSPTACKAHSTWNAMNCSTFQKKKPRRKKLQRKKPQKKKLQRKKPRKKKQRRKKPRKKRQRRKKPRRKKQQRRRSWWKHSASFNTMCLGRWEVDRMFQFFEQSLWMLLKHDETWTLQTGICLMGWFCLCFVSARPWMIECAVKENPFVFASLVDQWSKLYRISMNTPNRGL